MLPREYRRPLEVPDRRNYFKFDLQQSLPLLLGGTAFLGGIELSTARISSLYHITAWISIYSHYRDM